MPSVAQDNTQATRVVNVDMAPLIMRRVRDAVNCEEFCPRECLCFERMLGERVMNLLNVLGLCVSTASSIVLFVQSGKDYSRRTTEQRKLQGAYGFAETLQKNLSDHIKDLENLNLATGRPKDFHVDDITARERKSVEEAWETYRKLQAPDDTQVTRDSMPISIVWAFGLLFVGFALQLFAEVP